MLSSALNSCFTSSTLTGGFMSTLFAVDADFPARESDAAELKALFSAALLEAAVAAAAAAAMAA